MNKQDLKLVTKLRALSVSDSNYWSFKGKSKRHHCHALIQYPAMMVPQMQGALIDSVLEIAPNTSSLFDPFVGSGTTLGESLTRGLSFYGSDINPLAVLSCQVKSGPFYIEALKRKTIELDTRIKKDQSIVVDIDFFGINKWFNANTQIYLAKIRRAIKQEPSLWARKVFWLTLCSTIRATCNSRSSTYKLHIKEESEISNIPSPLDHFTVTLQKNIQRLAEQKALLKQNVLLKNGSHYIQNIDIKNIDIRGNDELKNKKFDLLVSSPPYGDNQTTVPYGQFSYLSLQWIDVKDIDPKLNSALLNNQNTIDSSSLGGSLKNSEEKATIIKKISKSFTSCSNSIAKINPASNKKLASFIYDLNEALIPITKAMSKNGYMIWTLGNRRVANIEVPLDSILRELSEHHSCQFVHHIERDIPSKRMASKNNKVNTMTKETILIMRKL